VSWLRSFGAFWWDFIVGDDVRIPICVATGLGLTYLIAHGGTASWWLMPAVVVAVLALTTTTRSNR
jgi:hypothetical protein